MKATKEQWSSKFGFIMAAAGSAIGLGNLWKFPYITGTSGGAVFVAVYIVFLLLLGIPILLSELAIGRFAGMNAIDSCAKIHPRWGFAGAFGVIGAFGVMASYSVVGGWVIRYIINSFTDTNMNSDYFTSFSAQSFEPILWMAVFLLLNCLIVKSGVSNGIEKVSTVLLPLLIIFLIAIMIYSLTLPNAADGVKFFLVPDFSAVASLSDFMSIVFNAMGQVFFSLSLGMGTLITYGSYLPKDNNLASSTVTIVTLDTIIAIISGLAILPAVFSFGFEPTEGFGLMFRTLPAVFSRITGGTIIATAFFILVLFAALTSSISLLEVIVSWVCSNTKLTRTWASVIVTVLIFIAGIFSSLSVGAIPDIKIGNMSLFEFFNFFSDKIIMPLGGLFICILTGYVWGIDNAVKEITNNGRFKFAAKKLFAFSIRYIAPALIAVIFASSLISFILPLFR
ncbi:MAG: sodium-dependent transporter [Oscillospiraceae bacterium]|nr:sodium-dependent transporter [Oscillospiraceae bacterium]